MAGKTKGNENVKNQHNKVGKTMKMHSPGMVAFAFAFTFLFFLLLFFFFGLFFATLYEPGDHPARPTHVSMDLGTGDTI